MHGQASLSLFYSPETSTKKVVEKSLNDFVPLPALAGFFIAYSHPSRPCYHQVVAPRPPMLEEQLEAFLEKVKGDASLQEKLNGAKSTEHVVEIAKDHEHGLSIDQFTELSDEAISP